MPVAAAEILEVLGTGGGDVNDSGSGSGVVSSMLSKLEKET